MASLSICSYNCRGLPTTRNRLFMRPDILDIVGKNDFVCFQETWFSKQDLHCVNTIFENFNGVGVSTTDYKDGIVSGHVPGGVAIIWKKSLNAFVDPIATGHDWCTAVKVTLNSKCFIIIRS